MHVFIKVCILIKGFKLKIIVSVEKKYQYFKEIVQEPFDYYSIAKTLSWIKI